MTCQTSCIHGALLSLSALEWRTRNGPPHSIHSQTPPPQAPSPSICLAMREKREWEREKKQWGVLMTIDLQVWVGSLPLIRLRWRPMGGPSLPPLLLHFLLVLLCREHRSHNSSICPSDSRALTAAAGLKVDRVVSHCWQMRTGNPRIEPDNGLGNWQAVDRTGCTTH